MKQTWMEIFGAKGISPSYTRTRIYAYLEEKHNHPTVDEIFIALKDDLPTLSKTTVYNVLKLFTEKQLVKPVNMSGTESRYEIYHTPHSHFKCTQCGEIFDIPHIKPNHHNIDNMGFKVLDEEVNLIGICPSCQQK